MFITLYLRHVEVYKHTLNINREDEETGEMEEIKVYLLPFRFISDQTIRLDEAEANKIDEYLKQLEQFDVTQKSVGDNMWTIHFSSSDQSWGDDMFMGHFPIHLNIKEDINKILYDNAISNAIQ